MSLLGPLIGGIAGAILPKKKSPLDHLKEFGAGVLGEFAKGVKAGVSGGTGLGISGLIGRGLAGSTAPAYTGAAGAGFQSQATDAYRTQSRQALAHQKLALAGNMSLQRENIDAQERMQRRALGHELVMATMFGNGSPDPGTTTRDDYMRSLQRNLDQDYYNSVPLLKFHKHGTGRFNYRSFGGVRKGNPYMEEAQRNLLRGGPY